MNYELALALKKTGFPHNINENSLFHQLDENSPRIYIPTLEELIEATPEMSQLDKHRNGTWTASYTPMPEFGKDVFGYGTTPEEAVAKLWLALQDK